MSVTKKITWIRLTFEPICTDFNVFTRTQWIYDASDALYPKIYLDEEIPPNDRVPFVRGRVREALRLSKRSRKAKKPKVFPYLRNVYSDSLKFLSKVNYVVYQTSEYFS